MERVAFLVESTGQRIGCLLNPEDLVLQRRAGVRQRACAGGIVTGADRHDDQLIYSGGGQTSLTLNLLFDVNLPGSTVRSADVRELTAPLWNLAENSQDQHNNRRPPLCRFIWGKSWNIPGIVTAVAERLGTFTAEGVPGRSWLRLRLLRVTDELLSETQPRMAGGATQSVMTRSGPMSGNESPEAHQIIGGTDSAERLDTLASRYYGDPALWRQLAAANNIDDPAHPPAGHVIEIPPLTGAP